MSNRELFVVSRPRDNVEYRVFDRFGNPKKLWQDNSLGLALLRWLRVHFPASQFAIQGVRVPVIFGQYQYAKTARNKIVNAGLALKAGLNNGSGSPTTPTYIAVGTGTTAVSASDTALVTETASSGLTRAAATVSLVTTSATNDTSQWLKSFSVTGTVAVTESGVFNASSTGTMLCRQTFSAVNVVNGDTLQITWKIQETSQN